MTTEFTILGRGRAGRALAEAWGSRAALVDHSARPEGLVLLAVPDRAVPELAACFPGRCVHLAGSLQLEGVPCAHPLTSFDGHARDWAGTPLAITGAVPDSLRRAFGELGFAAFDLPAELKPLYHAAAVLTSGHAATLWLGAEALLRGQGVALPGSRFLTAFHGLPGNQALALATDTDGLLFVGTPSGLGAVRGARVAWRLTSGDGKLPHPWVTALARFGDALYVGTYGGGLTKRTAAAANQDAVGAFDPFVETEGLKVSGGCLVAAQGTLHAGTDGQGLFRLSRDGSRFLPLKVPLPSPHITAILPTPDGLYVGTDEGLARIPLPLPSEGG